MSPTYVERLGLKTWKTNVGAQKIDGSTLETFEMVIVDFQIVDKGGRHKFFQKTFLVADNKFEMILKMPFLKPSNADILFGKGTLTLKYYTTNKVLSTIEQVQLIDPPEFIIAALDVNSKTFVMHMAIQEQEEMAMDPDRKAQIKTQIKVQSGAQSRAQSRAQYGVQVGAFIFDEAPTEAAAEYFNYSNNFLAENAVELPEIIGINEHTIKLKEDKQPFFGPIYSLSPVELETLKIYIETNLDNDFIRLFKSLACEPILFN